MKKKFQLPKKFKNQLPMNLMMFGGFYKANEENGINLAFMKGKSPVDIDVWSDIVEKGWKPCYEEILNDFGSESKALQFIKEQTEYYIGEFWSFAVPGSNGKQPLSGEAITVEWNKQLLGFASLIMGNIKILTEMKAIPNDDLNGMHYAYMGGNNNPFAV